MHKIKLNAAMLVAFMAFSPSLVAAKDKPAPAPVAGPTVVKACAISDVQGAQACSGYFAGNLNGGSSDKIADSQFALAQLGYTWDGNLGTVEKIESFDGNTVDFATLVRGISFVSIHYGAGQGPARVRGGTTGFYRIDGLAGGLNTLATYFGSLSNAVLYKTDVGGGGGGGGTDAVPEPSIWMQFILGFGLLGAISRRRVAARATAGPAGGATL